MFYANCRPDEVKRLFRTAIFKARFENIHRLDVSFNKGIGSYLINLPRESAEIFVDSKDTLSGFSFQKEANSEKYSGERNLMKAASIHYSSSHERLGYAIDGVLLDAGATGKIAASSRTLTIRLNDQSYKKRIGSQTTTTGVNSSFPCRVVDVPNFEDGHVTDFKLRGLQFGVAIKIQKPPEQSYTDKEQDAVVAQAAGKIEVGGLTSDEWQRLGTQGAADGLILFRGVRRLSIQDVQMETQETDRIFLTAGGERGIIGGFTDSGRLEFEGPAHALFKNQFRLIPTRWEQFDLSVRVLFLTIIASAVSGIATALVLTLRRNDSLYWPSV